MAGEGRDVWKPRLMVFPPSESTGHNDFHAEGLVRHQPYSDTHPPAYSCTSDEEAVTNSESARSPKMINQRRVFETSGEDRPTISGVNFRDSADVPIDCQHFADRYCSSSREAINVPPVS